MEVKLLNFTSLLIAIKAIRKCYDSCSDNLGDRDMKLLESVIKNDHTSTIEHINFTFEINGISRACLQELARHRHASLSVESTRYTLRNLVQEYKKDTFLYSDYLVLTNDNQMDLWSIDSLNKVISLLEKGYKNDQAKYLLPESYKTNLIWTINARSLRNFFKLRSSSKALWEIRELANNIFKAIPDDHKILFKDIIKGDK
ncbi:FAD-dependent thymidylate synthase [Campylobacter hyointestinalis]|uniref:Flavin-dependent thymidylate synthase n=1 Tax=Campylobacter hyointestinalis TaxID=198 RepID=A0A562XLT1_CAMHY|nr:FAD-dependent thymidylate synthase [Campylobacter hyointestinalis]TWO22616.1 FAD-dependent thymidylate synthase [Campylobacter hyointestinalis]